MGQIIVAWMVLGWCLLVLQMGGIVNLSDTFYGWYFAGPVMLVGLAVIIAGAVDRVRGRR